MTANRFLRKLSFRFFSHRFTRESSPKYISRYLEKKCLEKKTPYQSVYKVVPRTTVRVLDKPTSTLPAGGTESSRKVPQVPNGTRSPSLRSILSEATALRAGDPPLKPAEYIREGGGGGGIKYFLFHTRTWTHGSLV